ncbi:MAG: ROK family transcriptional regulator [Thermoactinospora sp.]|nr:ROK family transcriptional regulator [Thermoactinospora sp.]
MITSNIDPQPADFADVRATNLSVVLRFVRDHAPCSRADIAAGTGLNKATVSSLVADLIERRLVREIGLTENRVGRPAIMLMLDGAPYAAIGVEINVGYVTAVAVGLGGERLLSWRRAFEPGQHVGEGIAAVAAIIRRVAGRMTKQNRQVLGLTVAVPGLIDAQGAVRLAPNLGWRDLDLGGDLAKALRDPGFPIQVDNDANLAALAEQRFGEHAGATDLVYLTGEIGVGAGVIMDGALRRGALGFSGEIGHIQLDASGPACRCGRVGCLEAMAGIGALLDTVSGAEVEEIERLAQAGDPATIARIESVGSNLGKGVAIVANLLNPSVVVLGGFYVPLAPWLLPALEAELRARAIAPEVRVVASSLGLDAAALGGAARVLDSVDSGRLPSVT